MAVSGTVTSWKEDAGFGFIKVDGPASDDVFVHSSSIQTFGTRALVVGETVWFDIAKDERGRNYATRLSGPWGRNLLGHWSTEDVGHILKGYVDYWNQRKGYGFIKENGDAARGRGTCVHLSAFMVTTL